jgi:hypothetical protein
MTDKQAKEILDKIVGQVFGYKNPFSLDEFAKKFAYDVRLPVEVNDTITGEKTWTRTIKPTKYITNANNHKVFKDGNFELPKQPIENIEELLKVWEKTNYMVTERTIEALNVAKSDGVVQSENIYKSMDIRKSKNILFTDGVGHCEYVAASQRNGSIEYCIRAEDCKTCTNCYQIIWSGKCLNSMFINDCYDLYECLFCSHLVSKKYWVANMPFEEAEYYKIKDMVVRWVLSQ